jgi:hypothetical protein
MFFSSREYSQRGISFDFGEGDGPQQTLILGEFVCDCVHANSPTRYQDHVDSTWDYYTYSSDQVTSGITHPSVAPNGQTNQTYAVAVNAINPDCWINSLFGNSPKPQFPQSVSRRSFGASYFTENFYPSIDCDSDYDEPCFTDPDIEESLRIEIFSICDGGIDKARKKIGLYGPGSDTVTFISPTHAAFCAHCVGYSSGMNRTVSYYNPSTQQFETVIVDVYDINYNQYTQRLSGERDIRIGKIRNAGVTFPVYHQYYLNPYSLKEYIQYSGKNLNEKLAAFMVNANGIFALWYFPYSSFNSLTQLTVTSLYSTPIISGQYKSVIKDVIQPKFVGSVTGDSGTNFIYFSKSGINVWPAGARAGQYLQSNWSLINGRYGIDDINSFLSLMGEPTLTEFVDYDSLYKIDDFIPVQTTEYSSMKINTKKFNKKLTVETNKYSSGKSIHKVKIKKETIIERHYK